MPGTKKKKNEDPRIQVNVRLSASAKARLQHLANLAGLEMSGYLEKVALGYQLPLQRDRAWILTVTKLLGDYSLLERRGCDIAALRAAVSELIIHVFVSPRVTPVKRRLKKDFTKQVISPARKLLAMCEHGASHKLMQPIVLSLTHAVLESKNSEPEGELTSLAREANCVVRAGGESGRDKADLGCSDRRD